MQIAAPPHPFDTAPWAAEGFAVPDPADRLRTMLTAEESCLLYWLARDYAEGAGVICDLGCFAGGSTARLAAGVADSGRTTEVHAFDHFTIQEGQKARYLYPAGIDPFPGPDMLPAVEDLLSPWAGMVRLHAGDICRTDWPETPVELLFVDAFKSPGSADMIAGRFFPMVIPGRGLIIQQDYLHWRQPWVPAQMELMAECFELVAWCRQGTAVFRCTAPVTPDVVDRAATRDLSDRDLDRLVRQAIPRFPQRIQRRRLACSVLAVEDNPGLRLSYRLDNSRFTPARVSAVIDGP